MIKNECGCQVFSYNKSLAKPLNATFIEKVCPFGSQVTLLAFLFKLTSSSEHNLPMHGTLM